MPQQPMTPNGATSQQRPNTLERWQAALERARQEGLHSFNVGGDPTSWFVLSSAATEAGYLVKIQRGDHRCQCDAAFHGDPVCKHRALVLDRLGMFPRRVAPTLRPNPALHAIDVATTVDLTA